MLRLGAWILLATLALGQGRVVILGVDGMDHQLTQEFLAGGHLPELALLAEQGSFAPLVPTNPAQSPTSWATLTTGVNPGRTGIFGFLRRSIKKGAVVPEMALGEGRRKPIFTSQIRWAGMAGAFLAGLIPLLIFVRFRRPRVGFFVGILVAGLLLGLVRWLATQIPEEVTVPHNLRSSRALWSALDDEGVPMVSLFAPCSFPAPHLEHGHLLCGLGVPDLQGTPGSVVVFRDGPVEGLVRVTQMGGKEVQLVRQPGSRTFEGARIPGPRHPVTGESLSIPMALSSEGADLLARWQDVDARLSLGVFSDFLPVSFRWGEILPPLRGLTRLRVLAGEPQPVVYMEPVQFDPRHQNRLAPITSPLGFGGELAHYGLFETLGWATATNPYQDDLIDDAALLDDVRGIVARRHAMVLEELAKTTWKTFFCVLSTPDRVQHMFWRDRDPTHPAHDAREAARRGDVILESYRAVDRLVGRVRREILRDEDTLLVLSDHGFAPFRHAVNLNRWLQDAEYLSAKDVGDRTLAAGLNQAVLHVDWAKTRAYSLGLGRIWLNLRGREPEGVVAPGEARGLADEISRRLLELTHEGRPVIKSVRRADELYVGDRVSESADLIVGFERGYRVSWNSCLLGTDEPVVFENRSRWSGDHCSVDPSLVPGVWFSSRKTTSASVTALDLVPTVRSLLGLSRDEGLEGRPVIETTR